MPVEIDNRTREDVDEVELARLAEHVLAGERMGDAEASILLVEAPEMQALNREHRGKDEVTDVLAFPIDEDDALPPGMPRLLGDVVVCLEEARLQAEELGETPGRALLVLVTHGLLHLVGYDHETDDGEMRAREDAVLEGLPDVPWRR